LLRHMGFLPLLLNPSCLPTQSKNKIEMAGSDKVDPAIPCLLAMFARHVCLRPQMRNRRRGDDGFPGFQSLQKMLARGLDMNVPVAICLARAGASE